MLQKMIEKYLDMEAYGSNLIIKEYCGFPKYLPLPCHMEHGWTPLPNALVTDLAIAKEKGAMFVYSRRRLEAWKKASKIPVYIMGSPFMHYREMKGIKRKTDAKGTIVFPSHSTIFLESRFNLNEYCEKLKALPKDFHPITICLLQPDIDRGRDKIYIKNGLDVVSAGPKLRGSIDFVRNFYELLSKHLYATSNEIGTYTFYAIEMGLPFFLYGEEPTVVNIGDRDKNIGKTAKTSDFIYGRKAIALFETEPNKHTKKSQEDFVAEEIGKNTSLKPEEMKKVLYQQTKRASYWLVAVPMYWMLSIIKTLIPVKLVYWLIKRLK